MFHGDRHLCSYFCILYAVFVVTVSFLPYIVEYLKFKMLCFHLSIVTWVIDLCLIIVVIAFLGAENINLMTMKQVLKFFIFVSPRCL